MNPYLLSAPQIVCMANDNDSLIPEVWAMEALATLQSNMVMANLVHRDFSELVQDFGDVVNVSRPNDFVGKRKTDADQVVEQDAVSPNIRVPLDQHWHISFTIKDGELSKAQPDLIERYLEPAARELAEKIDQALAGQSARLQANQAGRLTEVDNSNVDDFILEADEIMNENRAPKVNRWLVLSSKTNKAALGADLFVSADKRGDEGTALREAELGRVYGFSAFNDQNVRNVNRANTDNASGVTDGAEAEGDTVIETTVPSASIDLTGGEYITLAGEGKIHRIASAADSAGDSDITLVEGLQGPVASGATVTVYLKAAVNGAQAAGFAKYINIDGHAANKGPQIGQWVTFGTGASSHTYTVLDTIAVSTTETQVLLDRPLDAAIADNDDVYPGPAGSMSLGFNRDAIALVSRPLATVPDGLGARSFVASFNGLSMRVTMQYQGKDQGMLVTFDVLGGLAILDDRMSVLLLG